ncbi:TadE/TadG family type IV pilus assembly protein [Wenxinia marina]|uniref:Flp pilus assembly protein TadG n=1 Tax=Wenxinia marina DSM 24838 TaxID=1123501 RepID=A0A0D0NM90_9RHOB|nr:TadE/TadG family type IV pilus assembly protein [Wenxinia marina]KIQ69420.1 Flp pilus assembly protein TadG [Wenxinia marina DSM 24838]GGL58182.1 hypothetical protein GCM10011392_10790 [Wenxinia marina]
MTRLSAHLRRFARDEDGTTLVEYAFVIALFLLLFFALIDFGRLSYHWVAAEKANHIAARIAAVRPAICPGVPLVNLRGDLTTARFGANCGAQAGVCATVATVSCRGVAGQPTVNEIWARVGPLLPNTATPGNLLFTYSYDATLGFLGGPYVPMVTVELADDAQGVPLQFQFATPLAGLGALAAGQAPTTTGAPSPIRFPSMSVSMPGEDLALGDNG